MSEVSRVGTWPLWAVVLTALVLPGMVWAQGGKDKADEQERRGAVFDEQADANDDIAAALIRAKRDNQRVLLVFGANWCGWCRKLDGLFQENREIARTLLYEYELVKIDVGRWDKNLDVARRYGVDLKKAGVPYLTVLNPDGKVLANQETGALEAGDHHDPAKVQAFLQQWKAQSLDAQQVLKDALAQAARQDQHVFLHFGAPWCGWCRRLEEFLARPEIAKIMDRDFLDVKIDTERMTHGKDVEKQFRPKGGGGIPWFAVLDAQGNVLATADGPKGNVGFPVEPHEIAHFMDVLKKTTRHMSSRDLGEIEHALIESAAKIKGGRE
jgi:thiol:disulfide interchange protein